jgi:hypothetical protein
MKIYLDRSVTIAGARVCLLLSRRHALVRALSQSGGIGPRPWHAIEPKPGGLTLTVHLVSLWTQYRLVLGSSGARAASLLISGLGRTRNRLG